MTDRLHEDNFPRLARALGRRAPELRSVIEHHGIPPFWERREGVETLVRLILEQQVSLVGAATLYRRIRTELGGMSARRLVAAGPEKLHSLGMTRQKARYCFALGKAIHERRLSLAALRSMSDADVRDQLMRLPGIGPWTASLYLMAALGRPDAWPPGDLALGRAIADLLPGKDARELARHGRRWSPHRAVAARLLWHHYRAAMAR